MNARMRRIMAWWALAYVFVGGAALTVAALLPESIITYSHIPEAADLFQLGLTPAALIIGWFVRHHSGTDPE